jgi:hypothetical protein
MLFGNGVLSVEIIRGHSWPWSTLVLFLELIHVQLSLLADVVILTPSDEKLTSAYPSAKLNSATSTNQNLPSKFWKVTSVDIGAE